MSGSTRSYEMARWFVERGHEVHMITSERTQDVEQKEWKKTVESGINVHWYPVFYSNKMIFLKRIIAFLKFVVVSAQKAASIDGDIVFATSTPLTIALPGIYAKKRNKIPMIFEVRDLWPEVPISLGAIKNKLLISASRWLEGYAYKSSEHIVALSEGMKAGVVKAGYPENKVSVIPNSSDNDLFSVSEEEGLNFRKGHSWLGDRPLIVYTGTHGKVNGVSYFVRLAKATIKKDPDIRFLTVGDGRERKMVADLAKKYGVLNKNFFMMGSVPKTQIPAILSAADIATSLVINNEALWANSANKFFDGLASGTTFAVNHGGWQAEILEQEKAGFVLHPTNIEQAANTLIAKISDKDWLQKTAKNAKRLAKERFDRDKLARELIKVLKNVASEH
jgi:glycosyltransferase involved in cell wall biosynthesis